MHIHIVAIPEIIAVEWMLMGFLILMTHVINVSLNKTYLIDISISWYQIFS